LTARGSPVSARKGTTTPWYSSSWSRMKPKLQGFGHSDVKTSRPRRRSRTSTGNSRSKLGPQYVMRACVRGNETQRRRAAKGSCRERGATPHPARQGRLVRRRPGRRPRNLSRSIRSRGSRRVVGPPEIRARPQGDRATHFFFFFFFPGRRGSARHVARLGVRTASRAQVEGRQAPGFSLAEKRGVPSGPGDPGGRRCLRATPSPSADYAMRRGLGARELEARTATVSLAFDALAGPMRVIARVIVTGNSRPTPRSSAAPWVGARTSRSRHKR